jgi:hypothetical protein
VSEPLQCPGGHAVGTKWERRACTELTCAEKPPVPLTSRADAKAKAIVELPPQPKGRRLSAEEVPAELKTRHELFLERVKVAGLPATLAGEKAVQWSQEKLTEMLPEAVANIQWDLRYGTAKERADATEAVLKANGVAQKEAAQGSAPTIVFHLGDSIKDVPFLQRAADGKKASGK